MATPSLLNQDKTTQDDLLVGPPPSTVTFGGLYPARVGDKTQHGETIVGPGIPNVTIEGKAISVIGDMTTADIRKPYSVTYWGPGPIVGPGATNISVG
jgi:hypothetical protein